MSQMIKRKDIEFCRLYQASGRETCYQCHFYRPNKKVPRKWAYRCYIFDEAITDYTSPMCKPIDFLKYTLEVL